MCRLTCWIPPTPVSSENSPIHIISLALLCVHLFKHEKNISGDQEFTFRERVSMDKGKVALDNRSLPFLGVAALRLETAELSVDPLRPFCAEISVPSWV